LGQRFVNVAAQYPSSAGDGVPGFLVDVVAARWENACTDKLRDRNGLSGKIRVSRSAN
jgi:hypothetical protein